MSLRGSITGHTWTVAPVAGFAWQRPEIGPHRRFESSTEDPQLGRVRTSGALHGRGSDTLVVVLHGLGGDIDSHYVHRAAAAARGAGLDCLRLNLRGADLSGEDVYHAGLTDDLHAAMTRPALAAYRRIVMVGYSLGGHLALRYASEPHDRRLAAVAAICPPLDLQDAARDIDQRRRTPYRRYVMHSLKRMVRATAARLPLPVPLEEVLAISRLRTWDASLVAPRFGFASPEDYYRRASVAPRLGEVDVPALLVASRHDPMVLSTTLERSLERVPNLDVRWLERGGHVGFPPDVDLSQSGPRGLEPQVMRWLST